jgi:hypothetical protein
MTLDSQFRHLLGIALLTVSASSQLSAQSTVSTPVVGFQKTVLSQGFNSLGFPLVKAPVLSTTTAASVSGSSISLNAAIPNSESSSNAYYLEVTSGTNEGERVDVTLTPGGSTVSIVAGSSNNTSSLSGLSSGTSVAIRRHLTLKDVDNAVSPSVTQNDDPILADRIYVFSGGAFIYYYKASDGVWYENGGLDDMGGLQINPGSGVLIFKVNSTASSITMSGTVRANKFARNYGAGYQTYAPAYPVAYSPTSMGANSWSGNADALIADKILPFSGGAFLQYYLDSTDATGSPTGTWYELGGLDPQNSVNLVGSDKTALIYRKNSDAVVESSPVN